MIRLNLKILVLVLVLLAAPVQAQSLKDAYLDIKKSAFKKGFKQLAMLPVIAEPTLAMPPELRQLVADEVLKKLTKSRFAIVPPAQVKQLQDQLISLYPGGVSAEAQDAIAEHTTRELLFRHPVDGIIAVRIFAVAAPFLKDRAEWGGTSQKMKHKGDGLFGSIMGKDYGGHITASAVLVEISDRAGRPVYKWIGGIEVMMQRDGQKLEALPQEELWQKPKRVLKAVKYALKPL